MRSWLHAPRSLWLLRLGIAAVFALLTVVPILSDQSNPPDQKPQPTPVCNQSLPADPDAAESRLDYCGSLGQP